MVNPSCPKTSADPMLGIHNGACGYACLIIAVTACHTAISMICHRKNVKPCKMWSWIENELIELINSNQFRLSIPIQFQFKIFQFNSNSIHAELNWIDYQFQFNSWIDPSPGGVLCAVLCSDHLLICSVMGKPWSQAWTQQGDYWNELNSRDRIPLKQKCIIWWNFHHWLHWLRCSQWWKFHQNGDVSVNEWKASQSCGHRWLANVDPM